jgi:hypothetical protein
VTTKPVFAAGIFKFSNLVTIFFSIPRSPFLPEVGEYTEPNRDE